jgi:hypothetical protein
MPCKKRTPKSGANIGAITGKLLRRHSDPKVREQWQRSSANEFRRTIAGFEKN